MESHPVPLQWWIQGGALILRFYIQILRNVPASGLDTPHYDVGAPTGNPGSATALQYGSGILPLKFNFLSHDNLQNFCNYLFVVLGQNVTALLIWGRDGAILM